MDDFYYLSHSVQYRPNYFTSYTNTFAIKKKKGTKEKETKQHRDQADSP